MSQLASALVRAIGHPGPGLAMAALARQRVLDRYDWDVLADKLEQVWFKTAHVNAKHNGQPE